MLLSFPFQTMSNAAENLLTEAVHAGDHARIAALLAAGADANLAGKGGKTPLYLASGNGHTEVVRLLLDAGADLNLAGNNGRTPLYLASENGHAKVVQILLDAGADANLANHFGQTALY